MSEQYIHIELNSDRTLQDQVREHLLELILSGKLPLQEPLPSSRRMSKMLGVSRNTVVLTYESLVNAGYLIAKPRDGYFIAPAYHQPERLLDNQEQQCPPSDGIDWQSRFVITPGNKHAIIKPNNWASFDYPFIYGQVQNELFPIEQWRDCARKTLANRSDKSWIDDWVDADDPMLVEQILSKLLPRRGIYAKSSEILITIGTQNSLYLLANLLCNRDVTLGLEDPGFRDAFNIFSSFGTQLHLQPVDCDGIVVDERLNDCDYLYLTPSHQVPTGAVLSDTRRKSLLELAEQRDMILIEDDYDAGVNMQDNPVPALKAIDSNNRVVYIGSMSKSISPGLRLGFMIADEELINEARSLRRLMYRHPPINNQQQLALFLSLGHYDSYLRKIRTLNTTKLIKMIEAIDRYLPDLKKSAISPGTTSIWLEAPGHIDTEVLAWQAAQRSILIEPGAIHFQGGEPPKNFFRLGFSAIAPHRITAGIEALQKTLYGL